MSTQVVNVVVAGLGGQGVVKASDILADAAFRTGLDVKKSEIQVVILLFLQSHPVRGAWIEIPLH